MAVQAQGNINYYFDGKAPKDVLFEDEQCIVYDEDENRQALVHFFVAPKKYIPRLADATQEDEKLLGHLLLVAKQTAIKMGLHRSGYHVMVDENHRKMRLDGVHVFGRALHHMLWPVGPGSRL